MSVDQLVKIIYMLIISEWYDINKIGISGADFFGPSHFPLHVPRILSLFQKKILVIAILQDFL